MFGLFAVRVDSDSSEGELDDNGVEPQDDRFEFNWKTFGVVAFRLVE